MSGNPKVYQENKPDCAHCGRPLEDSDDRVQRAGKIYHREKASCYAAYDREGSLSHDDRTRAD